MLKAMILFIPVGLKRGGVGLFLNYDLEYKCRSDLDFFDSNLFESIFVEIIQSHESNIIVGNLYRPPGTNLSDFNQKMNEILNKLSNEHKPFFLIGAKIQSTF